MEISLFIENYNIFCGGLLCFGFVGFGFVLPQNIVVSKVLYCAGKIKLGYL